MDRDNARLDSQTLVGLNKASAYAVAFFVALLEQRGKEQYDAMCGELAELALVYEQASYRYTSSLADEFVRMLRGECKKGTPAAEVARATCFRAAVWNLELELAKRGQRRGGQEGAEGEQKQAG
jgi:hypothetical protein